MNSLKTEGIMKFCFSILVVLFTMPVFGQSENLVDWKFSLNEDGTALEIEATIDDTWVIYSQHTDPEGPIPLEFEFTEIAGTQLSGSVVEMTEPITEFSEMFDVEVKKFKKSAKFMQKLMPAEGKRLIKGMVTYMACDATRCLPPKSIPFEVE